MCDGLDADVAPRLDTDLTENRFLFRSLSSLRRLYSAVFSSSLAVHRDYKVTKKREWEKERWYDDVAERTEFRSFCRGNFLLA